MKQQSNVRHAAAALSLLCVAGTVVLPGTSQGGMTAHEKAPFVLIAQLTAECKPRAVEACQTDLLGVCAQGVRTCSDEGFWNECVASRSPGAEVCSDGLDNDCDGTADQADTDCWECNPGDTEYCDTGLRGECTDGLKTCGADGLWGACAQSDQPVAEACTDGLDNDCDGAVDASDSDCWECRPEQTQTCATGLPGVCAAGLQTCGPDGVWGSCAELASPVTEVCADGLDNDCDGTVDRADIDCWECTPEDTQHCATDLPGICADGRKTCGSDGRWSPCAQSAQPVAEVCADGLDNDCDSTVDAADSDCWECRPGQTQTCATDLPGVCAAGQQTCGADGLWGPCAQSGEPVAEVCADGLDNDCDGTVDRADTDCWECSPGDTQSCATDRPGVCVEGLQTCGASGVWGACAQSVQPVAEVCADGLDNDCDGAMDAADADCWECRPGQTQACVTDLPGVCAAGLQTCGADGFWSPCAQTVKPVAEVCADGLDNNCDGAVDQADTSCWVCNPGDTQYCATDLPGICADGLRTCGADGVWGACAKSVQPVTETCADGLDNDCDGAVDQADADCASQALDCSGARPSTRVLSSPEKKFVPVTIEGILCPDGSPAVVTVSAITQDEPVDAKAGADASGVGTATALIRADRLGDGNGGRVYVITFNAEGCGAKCQGTVSVCVPPDMAHPDCIDDGQRYDSTVAP